jgi:hypothetical protein
MRLFQIGVFGALFAVASSLVAQTNPGDMVVDVPFTFNVAGQALPPGHYIVAALGDALRISNYQARGIFVPTHAGTRTASDGSKLVFHRYGDTYFLSAVWVTGNTTGRELFRSPAERELATHKTEMELAIVRPEDSHPSK